MLRSLIGVAVLAVRVCIDVILSVAIKVLKSWAKLFPPQYYCDDINGLGSVFAGTTLVLSLFGSIVTLVEGFWLWLPFFLVLPAWPMLVLWLIDWYKNPPATLPEVEYFSRHGSEGVDIKPVPLAKAIELQDEFGGFIEVRPVRKK